MLNKRFLSMVAFALVLLFPTMLCAQAITTLEKGQPAPWKGLLLSGEAQAKIKADKESSTRLCQLKIKLLTEKRLLEYKFKYDLLDAELDASKKKLVSIVEIKDNEIKKLRKLAVKGDYSKWWLAGGVVVGVAITVASFMLTSKVQSK